MPGHRGENKNELKKQDEQSAKDPTKGLTMVMLSVATSIDALAVGFSLSVIGVSIWFPAFIIGLVAGLIGFYAVISLKHRIGYDDSLDAFGVHGVCGIWGALATGLFANPAITEGASGLFYGNPGQFGIQVVSIVATVLFTAVGTLAVTCVTRALTGGLRVDSEEEIMGLDSSVHGERAFEIGG